MSKPDATKPGGVTFARQFGRLRQAFRRQLRGVAVLAGISAVAASLEVTAIAILVLLGKLTAEGKTFYSGRLGWLAVDLTLTLRQLVLAGVAAVVARLLLQLWESWLESRLCSDFMADQRNRLFGRFNRAPWDSKADTQAAELQTLLTSHVDRSVQLLMSLVSLVSSAGTVLVLLGSALLLSPIYAFAICGVAAVLFFFLRPLARHARRSAEAEAAANLDYSRQVNEAVVLAREIQVFDVGPEVELRVSATVDQTRRRARAAFLSQRVVVPIYQNAVLFIAFCALATVVLGGVPQVEVLGIIVLLLLRTASYTQGIQSVYHHVVGKSVYLDRLAEAEEKYHRGTAPDGTRILTRLGTVRFSGVSFAYRSDAPVLHELSFELRQGEMVGVVGPSGAGKSTLVKLLLGLYRPQAGTILVDGGPFETIARSSWYERVAYVPQEPLLINGTVFDNIRFFRPEITCDKIKEAARLASVHDTVLALPQGYDTPLVEGGSDVSGGQKQRICIARALVGAPDLIILDEPTSALDALSEAAIRETLQKLHGHVTTLIIAHRMSLLDRCDSVLVLDQGRLQAEDTPERLAATNAFFRTSRHASQEAEART